MMWLFFLKQKSDTASVMIPFLKDLKTKHGKKVKYIHCDNVDENKVVNEKSKNDRLGIKFEYMAPGTPQQNGMVERAFVTLYGQVRSMMNQVGFTWKKCDQLWAECTAMATKLEVIMTN